MLHNACLYDVLKVKPLVQGVRLLRTNLVQTSLTPLHQSPCIKFGFSGVSDSDFHVLRIRIFGCSRFGFSEPAGQGRPYWQKGGEHRYGTPRPLNRARLDEGAPGTRETSFAQRSRIVRATARTPVQALPHLNLILRLRAPYFRHLPSCLLASS